MKRLFLSLAACCMILTVTSCTSRLVDFTIISTKNMDLSKAATFQRAKTRVEGEDISHIIIFIPLTMANMKEAIDNALEKVPGAVALVDGVLYQKMYIFILYDQVGFIIEGTPLVDPSLAKGPLPSSHMICRLDGSGKVEDFSYVTKDEYDRVRTEAVGAD